MLTPAPRLEPSAPDGSSRERFELSRAAKIAPRTAVPSEPPISRKSVAPEVATPRSLYSTAFCTAITSTCITSPNPRPSTSMMSEAVMGPVSVVIRESRKSPREVHAVPISGNTL